MRVLVIGSGGREHALVWKLAQEAEVLATPGNPGIEQICETFNVRSTDTAGLVSLAQRLRPDFVLVGPEDPLIAGLGDALEAVGLPTFGPSAPAAQLEGSKAFAKSAMSNAGVPTAEHRTFTDASAAADYASSRFSIGRQVAVKASGAALGKGVEVCDSLDAAYEAIGRMLVDRVFGQAGSTIVIEDRLVGREFSLLTLVGDRGWTSLPAAQDYKRAHDGDRGPNTGGMGSVCTPSWVTADLVAETEARVVAPILEQMRRDGKPFKGTLFSGLMVQDGTPYCLEYNVRFGDPETQSVVRRIGAGFAESLLACTTGAPVPIVQALPGSAVTVVLAAKGYPGSYAKGVSLAVPTFPDSTVAFHAGTRLEGGQLESAGGRVIGISAIGDDPAQARARAYVAVAAMDTSGLQYRTDIGLDA